MSRFVALLAAAALGAGCAAQNANQPQSAFGLGKNGLFMEQSITRDQLHIRRVAIVPNRLPAALLDPEKWRQHNFKLLEKEFKSRGFDVVDYDTASRIFESSGLPVEDTSVSRDKYAEFAQALGVDAVVVPYYGTQSWLTTALIFSTSNFAVTGTFQVFVTEHNDFLSRIDVSATKSYTIGTGISAGVSLLAAGMAATGEGAQTLRTVGQIGMGVGALYDLIYGAVQGARAPDAFWSDAFEEAISKGMKPFFEALGPPGYGAAQRGTGAAPVRRPSMEAPAAVPSARCATSNECPAGKICLGGTCQ